MTTLLICILAIAVLCLCGREPYEFSELHYIRRGWRTVHRSRFIIGFRVAALFLTLAIIGTLYLTGFPRAEARARRESVHRVHFSQERQRGDRLHYVTLPAAVTREQVLAGEFGAARR
jgi:hypothetical protein